MSTQAFLLKQALIVAAGLIIFLPRHAALVPSTAYYTEFQVSAPVTPSLLHDLYEFLAELCLTVPGLPCSAGRNVTAA